MVFAIDIAALSCSLSVIVLGKTIGLYLFVSSYTAKGDYIVEPHSIQQGNKLSPVPAFLRLTKVREANYPAS